MISQPDYNKLYLTQYINIKSNVDRILNSVSVTDSPYLVHQVNSMEDIKTEFSE
jgi:hypothetical protein